MARARASCSSWQHGGPVSVAAASAVVLCYQLAESSGTHTNRDTNGPLGRAKGRGGDWGRAAAV